MSDASLLDLISSNMDDQMVPQAVNTIPPAAANTPGFESYANQTSPDLELLLQDLSTTTELQNLAAEQARAEQEANVTLVTAQSAPMNMIKHEMYFPAETYDYTSTSLYDDLPPHHGLKPQKPGLLIKEEACSDGYMNLSPCGQQRSLPEDLQQLYNRILCTCKNLDIPADPNTWTPEHVDRWIRDTLNHYSLPHNECQSLYAEGRMGIDVTLTNPNPEAKDFISTELDIWKAVHSMVHPQMNEMSNFTEQSYTESFLSELNSVSPTSYYPGSSNLTTLTTTPGIPTSVITYTTTQQREAPMEVVSPNQVLCQPQPPQPQHHQPSHRIRLSPAPSLESLGSCSSTRWTSSPESCPETTEERDVCAPFTQQRMRSAPSHSKHTIHLWQFLKELLQQPHNYSDCIRWMDRSKGIFKIEESSRVAKLWGQRKNRPAMNYDKLSRSIRQYYKKGIIKKTSTSKRLVYQFQPQYMQGINV